MRIQAERVGVAMLVAAALAGGKLATADSLISYGCGGPDSLGRYLRFHPLAICPTCDPGPAAGWCLVEDYRFTDVQVHVELMEIEGIDQLWLLTPSSEADGGTLQPAVWILFRDHLLYVQGTSDTLTYEVTGPHPSVYFEIEDDIFRLWGRRNQGTFELEAHLADMPLAGGGYLAIPSLAGDCADCYLMALDVHGEGKENLRWYRCAAVDAWLELARFRVLAGNPRSGIPLYWQVATEAVCTKNPFSSGTYRARAYLALAHTNAQLSGEGWITSLRPKFETFREDSLRWKVLTETERSWFDLMVE